MPVIERFPSWFGGESFAPLAQTKNLRLWIFSTVFLLIAAAGLIYNYSRLAEYRAGARLEIIPAEKLPNEASAPAAANNSTDSGFLTELQLLTARASLEKTVARIRRAGFGDRLAAADPVLALQRMISVEPVSGTQVAQLWAVGAQAELLPVILNEVIATYQSQIGERFVDDSSEALDQAREEVAKYRTAILQKRGELETFRIRYGIVSQEREENEITSRAKGLNSALNAAEEKALTAQTKLRSLRAAVAAGKASTRAKDNPTLAAIEQRLSQAREDLKQLERRYTPAYLAREPQAVGLKTKIPELEEQIRREREASAQANLAEAEQEAAQTQEALESLKRQLSGERQSAQSFSARLGEYTALQSQLASLEKLQGGAAERLVKIEAREGARKPRVRVIQSATLPNEPWRPNYHRDAALVVAGALVLGWLAAWLADFLVRRESGPTLIVAQAPLAYPVNAPELMQRPAPALAPNTPATQLPSPRHLPRELDDSEIAALLEAADDKTRVALVALLCGLSPEELIALTWNDLDFETATIKISRPVPRSILIGAEASDLLKALKQQKNLPDSNYLLSETGSEPLPLSHLESLISYAAHDAGLQQPAEVNPWVIRHTFISHLVRQGIRFSELARIVGTLPAEVTAAYGALLPSGARRSLDPTDQIIPALREFAKNFAQTSGVS
jgi:succinoglycan biosynthesis transport protein ExoP